MQRSIWILVLILVGGVAAVAVTIWTRGSSSDATVRSVRVARGTVVRRATAVGRIEVDHEVPVKSRTGGILTRVFVTLGQKVAAGEPLAEVRPPATEGNVLAAERTLEQARLGEENVREYVEQKHLASVFTRFLLGSKNLERMEKVAALSRQQAEEQLKLLQQGAVDIDDRRLDYILRAPVAGHVLEIGPREGAPVVPSSSYGSGSVVVTLADMDRMVFRGTVDETDVGRLASGMKARVRVGALPGVEVEGTVVELALKARERNNAVVFAIRIDLAAPESVTLRSGYSAVAEIDIDRRDDVLILPERMVVFRDDQAFVDVRDAAGQRVERKVETGLSDGLTVEIVSGLTEEDDVLERVYK